MQFLMITKKADGEVIVAQPGETTQLAAIDTAEGIFDVCGDAVEAVRLYRVESTGELALVSTYTHGSRDLDTLRDMISGT